MKHLLHIVIGISLLTSCKDRDMTQSSTEKPEDNRFTKVILTDQVDQPMQFDFLKDGRIVWVEREGKVKVFETECKALR